MSHYTPARLPNIRSDPSASTIRKTSIVQWNKLLETPMLDDIKSPHQIANELRKTDFSFETPPSFIHQSKMQRNPNESFEIDACEVSMLLSEDFPDIDQRSNNTPKTRRIVDSDIVSSNDTPTQKSFIRSRDVALDSLDHLVSTSPCKRIDLSSYSTPRLSMSRFLKTIQSTVERRTTVSKVDCSKGTGPGSTIIEANDEQRPNKIEDGFKNIVDEIEESTNSVSGREEQDIEVTYL